MADDEEIRVRATLIDAFSKNERVVERAAERLGNEFVKTAAKAEVLDKALDDVGDEALETAAEFDAASAAVGRHRRSVEDDTKAQARWNREANKTIVNLGKMGKLRRTLRFLTKGALIGTVLDGVTALVGLLNGVAAAGGAAVNGLAPLVGLLGALPGLLASSVQGLLVAKIATKGLGEAFKSMDDAQKFNEALEKLSPNARAFAREVRDLRKPWGALQQDLQDNFFEDMDVTLERLSNRYLPILNKRLGDTSTILNRSLTSGSNWLASSGGSGLIDRILMNNNTNLPFLLSTVGNLFRMTLHFMDAADVLTNRVSRGLDGWSSRMEGIVKGNKTDLRGWLSGVYDRWIGVKNATWDYFKGTYGLFKGMQPLTDWMGSALADIGEDFAKWANSAEGQNAIQTWATDMIPVVEQIGLLIRDLSKAWADIAMDPDKLVPMLETLRTDLLPAIVTIFESVEGKFLPSFITFVEAIAKLADEGALDAISNVIGIVADGFMAFANAVEAMNLGKLVEIIGTLMLLRTLAGAGGLGGLLSGGGMIFGGGGGKGGGKGGKHRGGRRGPTRGGGGKMGGMGKFGYGLMGLAGLGMFAEEGPVSNSQRLGLLGGGLMTGSPYAMAGAVGISALSFASSWKTPEALAANRERNAQSNRVIQQQRANAYDQFGNNKFFGAGNGGAMANLKMPVKVESNIEQVMGEIATLASQMDTIAARKRFIDLTPVGQEQARAAIDSIKSSLGNLPGLGGVAPKAPKYADDRRSPKPSSPKVGTPVVPKVAAPKVPTVTPRVNTGPIDSLNGKLRALNGVRSNPKVDVKGAGTARSIIDNVRSAIAGLRDKTVTINMRASGVKETTTAISVMGRTDRWTGGPVSPGTTYTVNELGPEAFVDRLGNVSMLAGGQHQRRFDREGEVIPANLMSNPGSSNHGMASEWAVNAFRKAMSGQNAGASGSKGDGSPRHYHYHDHSGGSEGKKNFRSFRQQMREMERENEERGS